MFIVELPSGFEYEEADEADKIASGSYASKQIGL